jgi:hypothetical protein
MVEQRVLMRRLVSQGSLGLSAAVLGLLLAFPFARARTDDGDIQRTLSAYVGQEVLVIDTTSGAEQFQDPDATLLYRVTLTDVQSDYFVVTRNVEGDKRSFVYPLAMVRRIITRRDGKPLHPIVLELY